MNSRQGSAESLIPYLVEKPVREKPVILVDSREYKAAPKVVKVLRDLGAAISVQKLDNGDYVVSEDCVIERKEIRDYVHTLTRRDLFKQMLALKEAYPKAIVIVEGYMPIIYRFSKIKPSAIWGSIYALTSSGIFVIHTTNCRETAEFIYTAAKHEQFIIRKIPSARPGVKKFESMADAQEFLVAGLPHIDRARGQYLLKHFVTPRRVFMATRQELTKVKGIGERIAEDIERILDEPYVSRLKSTSSETA